MEKADKGLIIEKRLEFILGLFMMLPSIIYVVWLSFQIIKDYYFNTYRDVGTYFWDISNNSFLFIYLSVLPLVGMYLIKNSFRYFFVKIPKTLDNATDKADKEAEEMKDNLLKG